MLDNLLWMFGVLLPMFALIGIVFFACDRQDKRKIELERVKAEKEARKAEAQAAADMMRASACFRDDVSQEDFEEIVMRAGRGIKRLDSLVTRSHRVYGTVGALSGVSSWRFVLDFDYRGHLTSEYSLTSENVDSGIPKRIASRIVEGLRTWASSGTGSVRASFCPYCGARAERDGDFCSVCGARIPMVPGR